MMDLGVVVLIAVVGIAGSFATFAMNEHLALRRQQYVRSAYRATRDRYLVGLVFWMTLVATVSVGLALS